MDCLKFYGREKELEALQLVLGNPASAMVMVSGRRRVGKSRLVDEFLKKNGGLKAIIVPKEEKLVAADFAEVFADSFTPTFDSVKTALEYFFAKSQQRVLHLDEFPNFLEVNPAIPYELQRLWELYKEKTDKVLILSGSYVRMMDKIFTRQKAPLFNRAGFKILLEPLEQEIIWVIQSNELGVRSPAQKVVNYCVFGGIPYYYEVLESHGSPSAVEELFFGIGPLREEGQNILRQEFGSAYKKYFSVLEAIGYGLVSAGEIANKLGLRQTTLSKYVWALQNDFKLIERVVPFDQNPYRSKKGLYVLKDNLLAFWFSLVYGKAQPPAKGELNAFIGKRFEWLCMDFMVRLLQRRGERVVRRGRWWGSVEIEGGEFEQREIDLIIETDKRLYVGECKWSDNLVGEKELKHLQQSAKALKTRKPVVWVLFNKRGFSVREGADLLLFDAEKIVRGASDAFPG